MRRWNKPLLVTLHGRAVFVVELIDSYSNTAELAYKYAHTMALNEVISGLERAGENYV